MNARRSSARRGGHWPSCPPSPIAYCLMPDASFCILHLAFCIERPGGGGGPMWAYFVTLRVRPLRAGSVAHTVRRCGRVCCLLPAACCLLRAGKSGHAMLVPTCVSLRGQFANWPWQSASPVPFCILHLAFCIMYPSGERRTANGRPYGVFCRLPGCLLPRISRPILHFASCILH